VGTDHRSATVRLTHSASRAGRSVIQRHIAREIPRSINPEMNVKRVTGVERDEKMLSDCVSVNDGVAIEQHAIAETPLRTGDGYSLTHKMTAKLCRDAVNRVALGHT
jgi:hypothetical protein